MSKKQLHILNIYPNEMNIYGDRGNVLTVIRRMELHGYEPVVHYHHAGQELPKQIDLVLGGGGQDSSQVSIQKDMMRIGDRLHKLCNDGVPMLVICGTYQLFGKRFLTYDNQEISGIGIFDVETVGSPKRMVGNVMVESPDFGTLVGFENHSGRTLLGETQKPMATVLRGGGNNGQDKTEGARTNNAFGCYLHGPMLPNNPYFADTLIQMAAEHAYGEFTPGTIDDRLADLTRANAKIRAY